MLQCHSIGSTTIGDSLAICEFLAESNPELPLWPRDRQLRALSRSAAAQMHSGFSALRGTFHTNFLAQYSGNVPISDSAQMEIVKMLNLWDEARKTTKERLAVLGEADQGFLFGGFSIADAFFWPVLWVCVLINYFQGVSHAKYHSDFDRTIFHWKQRVRMHWRGWQRCGMILPSRLWLGDTINKLKTRKLVLSIMMTSFEIGKMCNMGSFPRTGAFCLESEPLGGIPSNISPSAVLFLGGWLTSLGKILSSVLPARAIHAA